MQKQAFSEEFMTTFETQVNHNAIGKWGDIVVCVCVYLKYFNINNIWVVGDGWYDFAGECVEDRMLINFIHFLTQQCK